MWCQEGDCCGLSFFLRGVVCVVPLLIYGWLSICMLFLIKHANNYLLMMMLHAVCCMMTVARRGERQNAGLLAVRLLYVIVGLHAVLSSHNRSALSFSLMYIYAYYIMPFIMIIGLFLSSLTLFKPTNILTTKFKWLYVDTRCFKNTPKAVPLYDEGLVRKTTSSSWKSSKKTPRHLLCPAVTEHHVSATFKIKKKWVRSKFRGVLW